MTRKERDLARLRRWFDSMSKEEQREYNNEKSRRWRAKNPKRSVAASNRRFAKNPGWARRRKHAREWAPGEWEKAERLLPNVAACGICGGPKGSARQTWKADHCHASKYFSGFLCQGCNLRLTNYVLTDRWLLSPKEMAYLTGSECQHCRDTYG